MSDQDIFDDIQRSEVELSPFIKKQILYVSDQVASYSGSITLETSTLSSSGLYADLRNSWLVIPYVVTLKTDANITANANKYMLSLKNGFHQIINAISVEMNGVQLVQQTPYINMYTSFKMMTSFSESDVKKHGHTIGFCPDSTDSFRWSLTGANKSGIGVSNNKFIDDFSYQTLGGNAGNNKGLVERARQILDLSQGAGATNHGGCLPTLQTANQATVDGKHIYFDDQVGGANRVYQFHYLCKIRMKDIVGLFNQLPLVKSPFLKIIIGYNGVSQTVTYTHDGNPANITMAIGNTSIIGQTNPLILGSGASGNALGLTVTTDAVNAGGVAATLTLSGANDPFASVFTATTNLQINANVARSTQTVAGVTNTYNHVAFQNVRLYVPCYQMNPQVELSLLNTTPTKLVRYRDVYQFKIDGVTSGSSFNTLISNSIVNPKLVIVIPIFSSTGNAGTSPLQSPFTSEPATTSPFVSITQFQVSVSGVGVFSSSPLIYDYDQFVGELQSVNALNGGNLTGIQSGLIGYTEFQQGYKYYVADVSRTISPAESRVVPKSITVSGVLNCQRACDLFCFVEYEKQITINLRDGSISTD